VSKKATWFIVLLAIMLALALSGAAADESSDLRKMLKSKKERDRLEAIDLLSVSALENSSSLIARCLRDPSPKVRAAAARSLGVVGDKAALSRLLGAAKSLKKDNATLAEVCAALGEIASPAAIRPLAGIAKREMSRNETLTKAAVAALGKIRDRESVKELIGLLGSATPSSTASTYSYGHPKLMAPIRAALKELTGERLGAHSAWADWWRRVKRGYKFPEDPKAALRAKVFRDDGHRFKVERPNGWKFTRPSGVLLEVRYSAKKEEAVTGYVQVRAYDPKSKSPSTAEELADLYAAQFEDRFKNIREGEFGTVGRLSGEPAIRQRLVGLTSGGDIVEVRQWIVLYRGNLFTLRAVLSSEAGDAVKKELDAILRSFKFI
jgi:HEAT repeat protein